MIRRGRPELYTVPESLLHTTVAQGRISEIKISLLIVDGAHEDLIGLHKADNFRRAILQIEESWRDLVIGSSAKLVLEGIKAPGRKC
ncbi:hypothetical protein V496_03357 [Pseudogymnoascus sp. VKM F-4515 (FW-2607)]|nr:hypothetical protein V496_03357 [Pseudogymnoascus sp. VKM F-4515 (FW-2607)]